MKRLHAFVSLAAAALVALIPSASLAQVKDKPATMALTRAELFSPRFHATGRFWVVEIPPPQGKPTFAEKLLRDFGAGALAEKEAYSFATTAASGPAPTVVKRVLKHYRCPKRSADSGGSASDTDCQPLKVGYKLPADPTDPTKVVECSVTVDADVIYLGRRAKTVKWVLDPTSPMATTSGGVSTPRIRLLDRGLDSSGQEVRGITFSDNTEDPQERGDPPDGVRPVFDPLATTPDGQATVWARVNDPPRRNLAKVFYYAVVLQLWSDALQDYVFCAPYDPTIANRGN